MREKRKMARSAANLRSYGNAGNVILPMIICCPGEAAGQKHAMQARRPRDKVRWLTLHGVACFTCSTAGYGKSEDKRCLSRMLSSGGNLARGRLRRRGPSAA